MQRARTCQLVKKAAPAGGAAVYTFRANDGLPDRYQDRVSVAGWKLDSFNANPVILYNHDENAGGFVGTPLLPIGKGRAYVQGEELLVDVQFDQGDEFAQRVEAKVAGGFLNAVSVRYLMTKYQENELGGFDSLEQDLLEISIVPIPGNQRATRLKSFDADLEAVVKRVVAEMLKAKAAEAPPEKQPAACDAPAPTAEAPAAPAAPEQKPSGGSLIQCNSCEWKSAVPCCPECGGEVTAFEVEVVVEPETETEPAPMNPATEAAAPGAEKPAVEQSLNLTELAKGIAALVLSLQEK